MPLFTVQTWGYTHCPTFPTLERAREELLATVAAEYEACKKRFGQATKVKNSEDNYTILIGGRQSQSRWSSHCILS